MDININQNPDEHRQIQSPISPPMPPSQQPLSAPLPLDTQPVWVDKFGAWLKEDWLLKLGALLLLMGFGWLTTYAFLNNWIGPEGRIIIGMLAGVGFMVLGFWRTKKFRHQGEIFTILGSTVFLLVTFAARELYGFLNPFVALGMMFLSTAFVAFSSVHYKSKYMAVAGLILAGIAPQFINLSTPNEVGIFSYLLVVTLGVIWVVFLTEWRELSLAGLGVVFLYSLPHFARGQVIDDKGILLLFAFAFTAVFFIANTMGILKLKGNKIIPDLITAGANGLFLIAWVMVGADDQWKSLILAAWTVVFAAGAFITFKITNNKNPFYVYTAVAIAMLGAATSELLDGSTLNMVFTLEGAIISAMTYLVVRDVRVSERFSLILAVPILLSFESIGSRAWRTSVFHKDFFVLLVLGIALFGLGIFFAYLREKANDFSEKTICVAHVYFGQFYLSVLMWLTIHSIFKIYDIGIWKSVVIALFTVVFAATSFISVRLTQKKDIFYIYTSILVVLFALITSSELLTNSIQDKGAILTITYALQIVITVLSSYFILNVHKIAERLSLVIILPIFTSVTSFISPAWKTSVFHRDFSALLVLGLIIIGFALFFRFVSKDLSDQVSRQINVAYLYVGSVYIYVLIWLSLHAAFVRDYFAVMTSLVLYTIIGLIVYFYGRMWTKKAYLLYGGLLLGVVMVRLFLVDVWRMELSARIITFFVIGALLVSTAFIGRKKETPHITQ